MSLVTALEQSMAAKDKKAENEEEGKKKSSFSFKKLLVPLLLLINLGGLSAGAYLTYLGTLGAKQKMITEEKSYEELIKEKNLFKSNPVFYSFEPFTVNLSDVGGKIIQVELNVEMLDEDGFSELASKKGHARDVIVKILNGKQHSDLDTIQGKLFLKDEISIALNKQLERGIVKDIFFSKFFLDDLY